MKYKHNVLMYFAYKILLRQLLAAKSKSTFTVQKMFLSKVSKV